MISSRNELTFSQIVIFADEKDSDCEEQELSVDENVFNVHENDRKKANSPLDDLVEWKRKSGLFSACRTKICDPLRMFRGSRICRECRARRDAELKKLCIVWRNDEIFDILLDYVYFRAIAVFDETAEIRFSKENPTHPYFVNFKQIQQFNAKFLENAAQIAQFTPKMRTAVFNHSELCVARLRERSQCEVCGDEFTEYQGVQSFVLTGRRYRSSNFKFLGRSEMPKAAQSREERIYLCRMHGKYFRSYFYLSHMDFLVHWNCYHRIQIVHSLADNLSAAEIINTIEPYIFRNLVTFFVRMYSGWNKFQPTYETRAKYFFERPIERLIRRLKSNVINRNIDSANRARLGDENSTHTSKKE